MATAKSKLISNFVQSEHGYLAALSASDAKKKFRDYRARVLDDLKRLLKQDGIRPGKTTKAFEILADWAAVVWNGRKTKYRNIHPGETIDALRFLAGDVEVQEYGAWWVVSPANFAPGRYEMELAQQFSSCSGFISNTKPSRVWRKEDWPDGPQWFRGLSSDDEPPHPTLDRQRAVLARLSRDPEERSAEVRIIEFELDPWNELDLLRVWNEYHFAFPMISRHCAVHLLKDRRVCGKRIVEAMRQFLQGPPDPWHVEAIDVLSAHEGAAVVPLCIERLGPPHSVRDPVLLDVLTRFGDSSALPAVHQLLDTSTRRKRSSPEIGLFRNAAAYLSALKPSPEVDRSVELLRERWNRLHPVEQRELSLARGDWFDGKTGRPSAHRTKLLRGSLDGKPFARRLVAVPPGERGIAFTKW